MTDEVQDVQEQQRPRISLQQRLGRVLADGANTSSDELRDLIAETENAAQAAGEAADRHHDACLSLDCVDLVAEKDAERAAMMERTRLEATKPRLLEKLAAIVRRENHDRFMAARNRVAARRDSAAKDFRAVRDIFDELAAIFRKTAEVDAEVDRINQSRPGSEAPLQTVELHARGLDAFSRSQPSISATVQLPDWTDSQRMVWPPPRVPMGVLVAASMAPSYSPATTDQWATVRGERDEAIKSEQQRVVDFYDNQQRQQRLKEEREAREAQERATPPRAS
jgi:hypothetical protein